MNGESITMGVCLQCGASRAFSASGTACTGCSQETPVVDEERYRANKESTAQQARLRGHKECPHCPHDGVGCHACDWTGYVREDDNPSNLLRAAEPIATARDLFAAHAMAALIALQDPFGPEETHDDIVANLEHLAREAYQVADAMMKERS